MKLLHYVVGPVQTNCYILFNEATREALIVDPGASGKELAGVLLEEGLELRAVLLTHGHFDHAGGIRALLDTAKVTVPIYALSREKNTLEDTELNASWMMGKSQIFHADHYMEDKDTLSLLGKTISILATPGHTIGGCCYYLPEEKLVFTGDSLFAGSVGRTDFKLGSHEDLILSIREKLLPLPEETIVLPGHGESSTIGREKQQNPYL